MSTFNVEKTIATSLGTLWDRLTDFGSHADILPSVDNTAIDKPGEFAPGFAWTETRTVDGDQFTKTWTVSSIDPYVSSLADGPDDSRIRYSFKPLGDDETTVLVGYDSGPLEDGERIEKLIQDDLDALASKLTDKD